jgi:hypothetical protein
VVTALWLDWWPLLSTVAFALTASLWCMWAFSGDAVASAVLSVPASCGAGGLISMIARRNT